MIHKYDIVIYGTGPGSLFFLEKFYNKKVSVAIIDSGGFDEIADEKIIDKVTGPIKFYNNSNKEKGDGFFGTCKYWLQKGVGGKLQKFDPTDFEENNWPFDYKKIDKYVNLVRKTLDPDDYFDIEFQHDEGWQFIKIRVRDRVLH